MSLRVMLACEVLSMDDGGRILQVIRSDTSINPTPDDYKAEILLVTKLAERLLGEVGTEVRERLREFEAGMNNVLQGP